MRAYLIYKLKTRNIPNEDLQKLLEVSEKTIRNKLSGRTDFTWTEAKLIRNTYFPEEDYDTLFESIAESEGKQAS
jgi:putative transcriptional regulator